LPIYADLARAFVTELLALPEPPTALVTANNKITVGALHALRDRVSGGEAPDVALVGFDDFELADLLHVTVVGYDVVEMGRQAAALAVSRAENPELAPRPGAVPTRPVGRGTGAVPGPGAWVRAGGANPRRARRARPRGPLVGRRSTPPRSR